MFPTNPITRPFGNTYLSTPVGKQPVNCNGAVTVRYLWIESCAHEFAHRTNTGFHVSLFLADFSITGDAHPVPLIKLRNEYTLRVEKDLQRLSTPSFLTGSNSEFF
jgi:hypothetical protein